MKRLYLPFVAVLMFALVPQATQAQDTARIAFTGMTPHVGQHLYYRVVDKSNNAEVGRTSVLISVPDFTLGVGGIQPGSSYNLDFFADLDKNGKYDFPGDHTWRIELNNVKGDTTVSFSHNTLFTDIAWVYQLTVALSSMNPHLGENFYFVLKTKAGGEIERRKLTETTASYNVSFNGIMPDSSYMVDFFADHNKNGRYDPPPTDHAWRITLDSVKGDTIVPFIHNTIFTDIGWQYRLTVALSSMNPHLNENLYFRLKYKGSGWEIERRKLLETSANFDVSFDSIVPDSSYIVDFFADHNKNGRYDAPGADHAWRISVDSVIGDTTVPFIHNTNFTDIAWQNKLTVNFIHMTPHVNQLFKLYLRDNATGSFIDSTTIDPITVADFSVNLFTIMPDSSYNVDFWADLSGNRTYDVPPTDHAWRIELLDVHGDTVLNFTHNTDFTDIGLGVITGNKDIDGPGFSTYPNPAGNELIIRSKQNEGNITAIKIFNSTGSLVMDQDGLQEGNEVRVNVSGLKPGLYILSVSDGLSSKKVKFVKE
jgi:hypothetical protein